MSKAIEKPTRKSWIRLADIVSLRWLRWQQLLALRVRLECT